ncbi:MAG: hypothetical protein GY804_11635 [Alphaproteobacteria bacterium]|nr:hypothetical protein [Alphaproteobacteria bacterium]
MNTKMRTTVRNISEEQVRFLANKGFTQKDGWLFSKDGNLYDLSAADILQIEYIEEAGLFVIPPSFNQWFLSLCDDEQEHLRADKWMLAERAYRAGLENGKKVK